jgi:hypothetical protein
MEFIKSNLIKSSVNTTGPAIQDAGHRNSRPMTLPGMLRTALSAAALRVAPRAHRRLVLARRLERYCRNSLALRWRAVVAVRWGSQSKPHIVEIGRQRNRISVVCPEWMIRESPNEFFHRLCGVLVIVAGAPSPLRLVADLSDGEDGGPGVISFCSRDPDAILIPDHTFVRTRGYAEHRRLARACINDWNGRSDRIFWRGQTTGVGTISKPQMSAADPDLLPRVRLCLALKDEPGVDAKLSAVSQSSDHALDFDRLASAGILGEYIAPIAWHGFKFAIDIDGNSNAWSNLFTRLIMGCCVLKIASPLGYRQWYYGELKPWTHYVPVKADLSDLQEMIAWCRANLAECARIAARGQQFAMARDFDTEIASAIHLVSRACGPSITTMK